MSTRPAVLIDSIKAGARSYGDKSVQYLAHTIEYSVIVRGINQRQRIGCAYKETRAADQTHEIVVPRNLDCLLDRNRGATATVDSLRLT